MAPAPATARRSASPRSGEAEERCYRLAPGCQVRAERFGLLFYDLSGPRLLFAETGDLLPASLLRAGGSPGQALRGRTAAERRRTAQLLDLLVRKGFLHEQPVR
ncbi:MAG: mycofactocin biosynthesis chaperone MftB [Deltaproteobacteria bacterium]|nr:mycofactocin biosynthesis chaperone MftB [Deltaproteobacteria bacterium]